jgi:hypothetical protein
VRVVQLFNGGANDDVINLGSYGYLSDVAGHVEVNNDAGSDTVYLNDPNSTSNSSFTVTDTSVTGSGFGGLTYTGLLGHLAITAGSGNNTVTVATHGAALLLCERGSECPAAGMHAAGWARRQSLDSTSW